MKLEYHTEPEKLKKKILISKESIIDHISFSKFNLFHSIPN